MKKQLVIIFFVLVSLIQVACASQIVKNPKKFPLPRVGVFGIKGMRDTQEDTFVIKKYNDGSTLVAVFDGHGGSEASVYLKNNFVSFFEETSNLISIPDRMRKTFANIDNSEFMMRQARMGSTAIVAHIKGNGVCTAHIGDSRAIWRQENNYGATKDHNVGNSQEVARIKSNGGSIQGRRVNGWITVTRSFGDQSCKGWNKEKNEWNGKKLIISEPDINEFKATEDTLLILASDGLYGLESDEGVIGGVCRDDIFALFDGKKQFSEINPQQRAKAQSVEKEGDCELVDEKPQPVEKGGDDKLADKAEQLAFEAIAKNSTDNVTVLIVDWKDDGFDLVDGKKQFSEINPQQQSKAQPVEKEGDDELAMKQEMTADKASDQKIENQNQKKDGQIHSQISKNKLVVWWSSLSGVKKIVIAGISVTGLTLLTALLFYLSQQK